MYSKNSRSLMPHEVAKILFFGLVVAYSSKSAGWTLGSLDLVVVAWLAIGVSSLKVWTRKSFSVAFVIYISYFAVYIFGGLLSDYTIDELVYLKIFASQYVLAGSLATLFCYEESNNLDRQRSKIVALLEMGSLILIIIWIYFIDRQQSKVDYAVRALGADNYLTVSDLLAMYALVVLSASSMRWVSQFLWLSLVSTALMMLGSRATIVVFLFAALIAIGVKGGRSGYRLRSAKIALGLFVLASSGMAFLSVFNSTITYRFMSLTDMSGDASGMARERFFDDYMTAVGNDVSCLVRPCMPEGGTYVHNIISVVQYFGLVGIISLIVGLLLMTIGYSRGWRPPVLALFAFCLIEMVVARSWVSLIFPVLVAYAISAAVFVFGTAARHAKEKSLEEAVL